MVRAFRNVNVPKGDLVVQEVQPNGIEVFFVPSEEQLSLSGLEPEKRNNYRVRLLHINERDNSITI